MTGGRPDQRRLTLERCVVSAHAGWAAAALLLLLPSVAKAEVGIAEAAADIDDLSKLSLEELALVEITSVSRRPEAIAQAAAAVFVISRDDIRRSGATSLPELLRLAPNLNVQRVNAVDYAISARGFNGFETSNKLLVLLDGRSLYSTLHSGVFWDARDVLAENIERIEVISGPGGALYGANAVNGVINIITRSAHDTRGGLVRIGVGNEDSSLSLRYGSSLGETGAWRAYLVGFSRDDSLRPGGGDATDGATGLRGGGRMDWGAGASKFTLQGDIFDNQVALNEDFSGTETSVSGGNVLARWARTVNHGELRLQAYYDRFERSEPGSEETSDTYDALFEHAFSWRRHQVVWGGGYRSVRSAFYQDPGGAFLDPAERTLNLASLFVQDQVEMGKGVTLTVGAKLEDSNFSGAEILPSLRLGWELNNGSLVWAAVSRAARTPNRIERDLTLPGFLVGGVFRSETLTAYEAGYRATPLPNVSLSISAYYNAYDRLRTASLGPGNQFPITLTNHGQGETYGFDAWGSYDVSATWRLSAGLNVIEKSFEVDRRGTDITGLASIGSDPDYQVLLRSQADLSDRVQLDVRVRVVDKLNVTPAYVEADAHLSVQLSDRLNLSLLAQNLVDARHVETEDPSRRRAFGRSLQAVLRLGF